MYGPHVESPHVTPTEPLPAAGGTPDREKAPSDAMGVEAVAGSAPTGTPQNASPLGIWRSRHASLPLSVAEPARLADRPRRTPRGANEKPALSDTARPAASCAGRPCGTARGETPPASADHGATSRSAQADKTTDKTLVLTIPPSMAPSEEC